MVFYCVLMTGAGAFVWWIVQSPVTKLLIGRRGVDPGQFGTASDHIEDIGLGPSWRSDGRGGLRESQVISKHTRRKR
jgi:hypothetical protein